MGARDTGWVQLYAENVQEAYDNAIQAIRIAEHPDVMLPTLQALDGFIVGHNMERLELLPDETVRGFIGTYNPEHSLLDVDRPVTYGPNDHHDYFFEHKRQQAAAMEKALEIVPLIGEEYGSLSGRYYGLMEEYRLDDAQFATVALGSTAGTAKVVVDELRDQGIKAGLLKLRCFRPFPAAAVAAALGNKKAIAVLDRSISFGAQGNPLFLEVCTALLTHGFAPKVVNYVFGLGGRDTRPTQIHQVYRDLMDIDSGGLVGPPVRYLGVRE